MKKLIYFKSLILVFILQLSCTKTEVEVKNDLFGKWKLNAIKDPKTDKLTEVPSNKKVIVEFLKDGIIKETYENTTFAEYSFTGGGSSFDLEDASSLRIINSASATIGGYLYKIKKLDKTSLIIEREYGLIFDFSRI